MQNASTYRKSGLETLGCVQTSREIIAVKLEFKLMLFKPNLPLSFLQSPLIQMIHFNEIYTMLGHVFRTFLIPLTDALIWQFSQFSSRVKGHFCS